MLINGLALKSMERALNLLHNDGNAGKFMRDLKNGEDIANTLEQGHGTWAHIICPCQG